MSDSALTALALVERLLMEDGKAVQDIAAVTPPEELGQLVSSLAVILASNLYAQHGTVGALEQVTRWRNTYVNAAAAGEAS